MLFDFELIDKTYAKLKRWMNEVRFQIKRPLTLSEKLLLCHLDQESLQDPRKGDEWALFRPDRVAMQDVTAQMTLLQFMLAKSSHSAVPTSVHCDHLIRAEKGALEDLELAKYENREVFDFLQSACKRYGIDFWAPGSGIIHQVVLENYAFPGGMMLGTDSHTPNAGGLGMLAIGVGGADAVDVITSMPWELKMPKIIGVFLKGSLHGWASSKDVILKLASILTVKGATGSVIEYLGPGARTLSCTGKATICNMGAEVGATCSIFPYDKKMSEYLTATGREKIALLANEIACHLQADEKVEQDPHNYYDRVIEIDLSTLEPHVNGPYTPDRAWPISQLAEGVKKENYPDKIHVALLGSCTNSSYEDIERAASLAKQASEHGITCQCPLTVTPGSDSIFETMKRDGHLKWLESIGAQVLANACGPCIGQWKRHDIAQGEKNTILTSYNRNFSGRNDANPGTHSFVTSPELVIALALAGRLSFNPLTDELDSPHGKFQLKEPEGLELPLKGFCETLTGYLPSKGDQQVEIIIDPHSERLAKLEPFPTADLRQFSKLRLLAKIRGKCTTDHICPAGKWLKFRGHLDRISDNLFSGAINAFYPENLPGNGINLLNNSQQAYSQIARTYKQAKIGWIAIGEENYGEGSSREHAAMEPRHLGARAIIVKSFARIHETNLKKHGLLALSFLHPDDYEKIEEEDFFDLIGLEKFAPGSFLTLKITHSNGSTEEILLKHSYNSHQIAWFYAGSALNLIAKNKSEIF